MRAMNIIESREYRALKSEPLRVHATPSRRIEGCEFSRFKTIQYSPLSRLAIKSRLSLQDNGVIYDFLTAR